jgi:retron-type reverse transcriptase
MKRVKNLYQKINNIDNIIYIYKKQVRINTKNKNRIENFEDFFIEQISTIKEMINDRKITFNKYSVFLIKIPKYRIIMRQSIRDKVINQLVAKYILVDSLDNRLIDSNVATRIDKGTHYGIKLAKKYINEEKNINKNFYILKCDVTKFFYNINHEILISKLKEVIKDKEAIDIVQKILNSTNEEYINDKIRKLKEREISKYPPKKEEVNKLPTYMYGKGLPIGNTTSQILAIFYLNELDHYIKEELKIKHYIRYMDDFILIHSDKEYLKYCFKIIEEKLNKEFDLTLNKKSKIVNIKNGLDFLGFRFILNNKNKLILKVRKETKKRLKKKIKKVMEKEDYKKLQILTASYRGHLSFGNCRDLMNKVLTLKNVDIGDKTNSSNSWNVRNVNANGNANNNNAYNSNGVRPTLIKTDE